MTENVVLVTGFGPFGQHKINASWEAVKLVPKYEIKNTAVHIEEIPVLYNVVDQRVPLLWKKYNPTLVVHVGVSQYARELTLETIAYRKGYVKTDCAGNTHCSGCVRPEGDGKDYLKSGLNVEEICKVVNEISDVKVCVSNNAGRYLCEYTFYTSLHIDENKVLFIHVPVLDNPYSAMDLAKGISAVIEKALEQLCL